jgi:hypothetical protein
MNAIVVDPATTSQLNGVHQTITLTDAHGRVLGHFVPNIDPVMRQAMEPKISEEELTRREQMGGGRPLAEILGDLKARQ